MTKSEKELVWLRGLVEEVSPPVNWWFGFFFPKRWTKNNTADFFFSSVEKKLSICGRLAGPQCITADRTDGDTHLGCHRSYLPLTDSTSCKRDGFDCDTNLWNKSRRAPRSHTKCAGSFCQRSALSPHISSTCGDVSPLLSQPSWRPGMGGSGQALINRGQWGLLIGCLSLPYTNTHTLTQMRTRKTESRQTLQPVAATLWEHQYHMIWMLFPPFLSLVS